MWALQISQICSNLKFLGVGTKNLYIPPFCEFDMAEKSWVHQHPRAPLSYLQTRIGGNNFTQ